jgi:hypothetical protein
LFGKLAPGWAIAGDARAEKAAKHAAVAVAWRHDRPQRAFESLMCESMWTSLIDLAVFCQPSGSTDRASHLFGMLRVG